MAKSKQDFYQILDSFVDELYADGTAGKWKVEKKLKKVKSLQRKASRKLNESRKKKTA